MPGGGGRGGPGGRTPGDRPSKEDMEARRALMDEVLQPAPRLTIAQDGDRVSFIEPDGVVRTYVANGKWEKHALTHGTIETKSAWDGPRLRMEITVERITLVRTFEVAGDDPRRLEVTTIPSRGPRDARRIVVYDEAPGR